MCTERDLILDDLSKKLQTFSKKLDEVLNSVSGYETRIRLIESNQINNNFDLKDMKEMFRDEIKKRIELEKKLIGLEDLVIKHYSMIHNEIKDIKGMLSKNGTK